MSYLRSTLTSLQGPLLGSLILLLAACNSGTDKPAATASTVAPKKATSEASTSNDGAWYRQYRTLLPGTTDSVTLHLQRFPNKPGEYTARLAGFYAGADGQPWEVMGNQSASTPDSLLLHDTSPGKVGEGSVGPRWLLRRQGNNLVGTLGNQPLVLRLVQPPASVSLVAHSFVDSVAARPAHPQDSLFGRIRLLALLPTSGPATPQLTAAVVRGLRGDTTDAKPAPALAALWEQQRSSFFKDYQEDVTPLLTAAEADTASYRPAATLNYEAETSTYVLWNADNLLSVGFFNYSYSGGAHGNYATSVCSYDTRTGRALRFADIFRPGSELQLEKVLGKYARPALGLTAAEPLSRALFTNSLPVTHNVYLTSGGAVFVYGPYGIASYAQGEIRIFVPFTALRPLLQPSVPVGGGEVVRK